MKNLGKFLAAGAAVAALSIGGVASAATVIDFIGGTNSTGTETDHLGDYFSLNYATGTLLGTTFSSTTPVNSDFVFNLIQPLGSSGNVQTEAQISGATANVGFDLFSGTPGSGTLLGTASGANPIIKFLSTPGAYYVEFFNSVDLPGTPEVALGETVSGNLTLSAAIPEPATWAMMVLGVGMLGAGLRTTNRRKLATA